MEELRRIRKEHGLTQRELAGRAGVVKSTIYGAEVGRYTPRLQTLVKIAAVLGVEVADFFPKAQSPLPLEDGTRQERTSRGWSGRMTGTSRAVEVRRVLKSAGLEGPALEKAEREILALVGAEA